MSDQPPSHLLNSGSPADAGQIILRIPDSLYLLKTHNKSKIFHNRQVCVKRRNFRQIADASLGLLRTLLHADPFHNNTSLCRGKITCQHVHGCRFSCTVRSEKPQNVSIVDFKRKMIHRELLSIFLRQILNFNHCILLYIRIAAKLVFFAFYCQNTITSLY